MPARRDGPPRQPPDHHRRDQLHDPHRSDGWGAHPPPLTRPESYFLTNGTGSDGWGACNAAAGCKQYKESNLTEMDVDEIGIYEPCNSASNLAYYRTAIGVCDHDGWAMPATSQQVRARGGAPY